MKIKDEMIAAFKDVPVGTVFTRTEIVDRVHRLFSRNRESIIPSDYCYNRLNNGINYETQLHLFEYTEDKRYSYLGQECKYTGKVFHHPKGCAEICVGELIDGVLISVVNDSASEKREIKTETKREIKQEIRQHKTSRTISLQLRYKILKRDNFKCCACGASPAKDPNVELHVDHIIPWSKGGETEEDNLQTLCSMCNLGKSNLY